MDIEKLTEVLTNKGAAWTAGPTRFTGLSREQRQRFLGVPESSLEDSLRAASGSLAPPYSSRKIAPTQFDWRNSEGNWIGPVRDQGPCNSCTAFAVCAVMESRMRLYKNDPNLDIELSTADLFFCGHNGGCAEGMYTAEAIARARTRGVGLASDFPYSTADERCVDISPAVRVAAMRYVTGDAHGRKLAISEEGPVIGEMRVYEDLFDYTGGVYRHTLGDPVGLHAVAVIGYDDAEACWIVKNSWGPAQGEAGFYRIGYGECELDARPFIVLDVESAS